MFFLPGLTLSRDSLVYDIPSTEHAKSIVPDGDAQGPVDVSPEMSIDSQLYRIGKTCSHEVASWLNVMGVVQGSPIDQDSLAIA